MSAEAGIHHALSFMPTPLDDSILYSGVYDPTWVATSVLLSIVAAYAALDATSRIEQQKDRTGRVTWALIAAFTMGIGVWAMHFIGMMALELHCQVYYDPLITLFSMVPGILASGVALGVIWNHGTRHIPPLLGSILLGAGIGTMHYAGMAAMRLEGYVRYDLPLFVLSILVAVVLSYLALKVRHNRRNSSRRQNLRVAAIMGSAVSGMHYTAMSAAYFVKDDVVTIAPSLLSSDTLAIVIATTTTIMALAALASAAISRNRDMTEQLRDNQDRFISLIEAIPDAIFLKDVNSRWLVTNEAAKRLFKLHDIAWLGKTNQELAELQPEFNAAHQACSRDDEKTWQAGKLTLFSKTIPADNGEPRDFEVRKVPIFDQQGRPQALVVIGRDISERKQAENEIRTLAFYDVLTQLPNRRFLLDRLSLALLVSSRNRHYGVVMILDMDKFKILNDTLGHESGDLLLIEVATRIKRCLREDDTVARLGGDEFGILLESLDASTEQASLKASLIAEKIRAALGQSYQLKGSDHISSPSIGVTLYQGNETSADTLLKQADMAMYQAKESGRNAIRFFDPGMQLAVETRSALEADLRHAILGQQLHLFYQIQVDSDRRPIGAEALIRWMHPTRGMVSPAHFIPIAEESSLIVDIGDWVIRTACKQLSAWSANEHTQHLTLAVNVSAQQFKKPDFIDKMTVSLSTYQIDGSRLKVELTESVVLNDIADVVSKMYALKALRIQLSMDDFGTGYSSLSYLKQMPLDQLKIDQSFVRDMTSDQNDAVMVQTMIDLAKNFHLNVIAEGVETEEQLMLLKHMGCLVYQGYLLGKPVPIEQFEASLRAN